MKFHKLLLLILDFSIIKIINYCNLKINKVNTGNRLKLSGIITINNKGNFKIGNNVSINARKFFNPVGKSSGCYFYTTKAGKISIGDNVSLSSITIYSFYSIILHNNVMIGGGTEIYDTDFHGIKISDRNNTLKIASQPIIINENVFIGANALILKGVEIGKNSIIAAGSVLTKSVPENEIWGGNPARFIKNVTQ